MRRYTIEIGDKQYVIDVKELDAGHFRVAVDGNIYRVNLAAEQDLAESVIRPEIVPAQTLPYEPPPPETLRRIPTAEEPVRSEPPPQLVGESVFDLRSPMPGTILSVDVAVGERVERGQQLFMLEAMKMKNPIRSPRDGVVAEVAVQAGQTVQFNAVLLHFQER